jgi:hypothetical protein
MGPNRSREATGLELGTRSHHLPDGTDVSMKDDFFWLLTNEFLADPRAQTALNLVTDDHSIIRLAGKC